MSFFSRSIEVYVPPDLLQIGIIITHKKSITTLVWHHGFGELTTNTAGTPGASTLCCPAFRRLRHRSFTLSLHVSPFAFVFISSSFFFLFFHLIFKDTSLHSTRRPLQDALDTLLFTYRSSIVALHISLFICRTSHIALHLSHLTYRACVSLHIHVSSALSLSQARFFFCFFT